MTVRHDTYLAKRLPALAAALLVALAPAQAQAQAQEGAPLDAPAGPGLEAEAVSESAAVAAIVRGLAADDLLNIRATASPIGLVLARVPNGSSVTRFECAEVRGNEWCRVELPGLEGMLGWTPARYLRVALPDGEETAELPKPLPRPAPIDASQITVGILPDPLPSVAVLVEPEEAGPEIQTVLLAPSTDAVDNRVPILDAAREARKIDGAAAQLALALAAPSDPAAVALYTAMDDEAATTAQSPADPGVPIPTPRPVRPEDAAAAALAQAAGDAELTVAAVAPAGPVEGAALDARSGPAHATDAPAAATGQAAPSPVDGARASSDAVPIAADPPSDGAVETASETGSPKESAAPTAAAEAEAPATPTQAATPAAEPAEAVVAALALPPVAPGTVASAAPAPDDAPAPAARTEAPQSAAAEPAQARGERGWRDQIAALLPSWGEPAPANAAPGLEAEAQAAAPAPAERSAAAAPAPAAPSIAMGQPPAASPSVPLPATLPAAQAESPVPAAAGAETRVAAVAAPIARPEAPLAPTGVAVTPAQAAGEATGVIPCARYVGQPMTRCEVRIARLNADDADVTVVWPDGGTRIIRFRAGRAESANSRNEFRATREAELNLIRIGSGERFEILDGVIYAE